MVELFAYHESIAQIESIETIVNLNVASYTYMSDGDRKKLFRDLSEKAYPVKEVMSFDDFFELMGNKNG